MVSCCCEWIYRKKELCLDFLLAKLASAFVSSNEICAKILKKSPHISTIHLISADDLKLSIMLCRKVFVCESNFISKRNFLFYTYRKKKFFMILWEFQFVFIIILQSSSSWKPTIQFSNNSGVSLFRLFFRFTKYSSSSCQSIWPSPSNIFFKHVRYQIFKNKIIQYL